MEVWHGKEAIASLFEPLGLLQTLTFGTVSIAARVVGIALMTARVTDIDMASECGGAAACEMSNDGGLL